jgi:hypothetical protein
VAFCLSDDVARVVSPEKNCDMSCMNDHVGSSSVSDGMHVRAADYTCVKIPSAPSRIAALTGGLRAGPSELHCTGLREDTGPRIYLFICREHHWRSKNVIVIDLEEYGRAVCEGSHFYS